MSFLQDLYNSLQQKSDAVMLKALDPRNEVSADTPMPTAGALGGNIAKGVGNVAGAVMGLPKALWTGITQPETVAPGVENLVKGVGNSVNNLVGQPVNPKTGKLQMPSVAEAAQNAYNDPVNAALNIDLVGGGISKVADLAKGGLKGSEVAAAGVEDAGKSLPPVESVVGKPGAIKVTLPADIRGAAKESIAQQAVDNIPGVTATEKYANLTPRMKSLSDNIDSYNQSHPVSVDIQSLRQDYLAKIQHLIAPESTPLSDASSMGMVTPSQAQLMADNYIRQNMIKTGLTTPIDMENATGSIPIATLTKMKQSANELNGPLLDKRAAGNGLTPAEQIQLASRDALDKTITKVQPTIKQMTIEQSGLYDATRPLNSARLAEMKEQLKIANQTQLSPGEKVAEWFKNPGGNIIKGAVDAFHPKSGVMPLGSNIGDNLKSAAGLALPLLSDSQQGQENPTSPTTPDLSAPTSEMGSSNPVPTSGELPTSIKDVKSDSPIPNIYNLKGKDGLPIALDTPTYNRQITDLNTAQNSNPSFLYNPQNKAMFDNARTTLKAKNDLANQLAPQYATALKQETAATQAMELLKKAPPSLIQAIELGKIGLDSLRQSTDPTYAALGTQLSVLAANYPQVSSIFGAKSPEVMLAQLQNIQQNLRNDFNQSLIAVTGQGTEDNALPTNLQNVLPQGVSLPPPSAQGIPNFPQVHPSNSTYNDPGSIGVGMQLTPL